MNPLTLINYPLDVTYLLALAETIKHKAEAYKDPRYTQALDTWKILLHEDPYITKVMEDLNIQASPRFYWQEPYSVLPMHVDYYTKCSVNFVLTDDLAPITIEDTDYLYKQAVLDTTKQHGVKTQEKERILLKLSISHSTYEDIVSDIPECYRDTSVLPNVL